MTTKREYDTNGWYEVKRNPISKVGVFPYLGSSIGADDPDRVYMVLRPPEELGSPEAMASMRLLPWVDDHTMLGDGYSPAEVKGVLGVTGEEIEFDGEVLYANLKLYSDAQREQVDSGKRELSLGYKCKYDFTPGVFKGTSYDVVQRLVKGNHLASVSKGRMGPDVAVLDRSVMLDDPNTVFTFDERDIVMPGTHDDKTKDDDDKKKEGEDSKTISMDKDELTKLVNSAVSAAMDDYKKQEDDDDDDAKKKDGEDDDEKKEGEDEEGKEKKEGMDGLSAELASTKKELKAATDSIAELKNDGFKKIMAEASKRDSLASEVSSFCGAFDHSEMTLQEVAEYAVDKLEIPCEKGSEVSAVKAYMIGRPAQDSAFSLPSGKGKNGSLVNSYINGSK